MKFARYLQDTQTPEWKKAYIDYRGLKKRISAIRKEQQGLTASPENSQDHLPLGPSRPSDVFEPDEPRASGESTSLSRPTMFALSHHSHGSLSGQGTRRLPDVSHENGSVATQVARTSMRDPRASGPPPPVGGRRSSFLRRMSVSSAKRGQMKARSLSSRLNGGSQSKPANPLAALPLHELLTHLSPQELAFFTALDAEYEKIETFYLDREKEMHARTKMLQEQLGELSDHKKLFKEAYPDRYLTWSTALAYKMKSQFRHGHQDVGGKDDTLKVEDPETKANFRDSTATSADKEPVERPAGRINDGSLSRVTSGFHSFMASMLPTSEEKERGSEGEGIKEGGGTKPRSLDPEDYLYAKKKLKKAVLEHYRGLEVLHNYRVLNITGFRKALKKFEKVTKIPAQHQYMTEKVEKSAFASDKTVRTMMKQIEDLYASVFVRGDKKRAMARLRGGKHYKSHHFSTFRSGVFLGLALPAFVSGLYHSFLESTRESIPGFEALLLVYGVLLLPVLFTILVGVNLLVWSHARINYVFIFELDVRTRLDHREYFETPSTLLAALCYAFWLSFAQIGASRVSPTIWPLVWLGFTAIVMLDPFPIQFKPSRYWLAKNVGRLLISGTRRVEFTDFWMGDQFCSLVFSLSNLYFLVCIYVEGFDENWGECGVSSHHWPAAFALASLPLFIRLVQSIKRYIDSRLITHLINGGKYGSGIISYLCYYIWRHQGAGRGPAFVLWCIFTTGYSFYATAWDFIMDWSVLRPRSQYPLLRSELVYSNYIPFYYCAIVSNILIRFIWVFYIPSGGPDLTLRTFIVAILEMLRRWQWNFFRLENEHLGNMDQYRVTREVPLPYSFDDASREDDPDEDGEDDNLPRKKGSKTK